MPVVSKSEKRVAQRAQRLVSRPSSACREAARQPCCSGFGFSVRAGLITVSTHLYEVHSRPLPLHTGIPRLRSKSKANLRKSAHNAITKQSQTMKRKHLFLALAALLAVAALWFRRTTSRSDHSTFQKSSSASAFQNESDNPNSTETTNAANPTRMHAPPDQSRKFREFTPEQRVEFARKGHGPGG